MTDLEQVSETGTGVADSLTIQNIPELQRGTCVRRQLFLRSDDNYFSGATTITFLPWRARSARLRPVFLRDRNWSSELWECGKLAAFFGEVSKKEG
jgi:hypothetical protein